MDIKIDPRKATRYLLVLAIGFALTQAAGQLISVHSGLIIGLSLFNPDRWQSVSRCYSVILLLLCSALFLAIAAARRKDGVNSFLPWFGLALGFLSFAITKETGIHENLAALIRSSLGISKLQFYAWAYGIFLIIFILLYRKVFCNLPRKTLFSLAIGGSAFVVGAFGLDILVAYLGNSYGHRAVAYIGLATLEDGLEMIGTIVLIYGLLLYVSSEFTMIRVKITER